MGSKKNWRYHKNIVGDYDEASGRTGPSRRPPKHYDEGSSSGPPRRAPKHLKGKEIGLWYRKQQQSSKQFSNNQEDELDERRKERDEERRLRQDKRNQAADNKPLGIILISEQKKENIQKLLQTTSLLYPSSYLDKTNSYEHLEETEFKFQFLQHITGSILQKLESSSSDNNFQHKNEILDNMFLEEMTEKQNKSAYKNLQKCRQKLPSMKMKDEILDLINKNQVVVLSGETGCGKTTQVGQFILDDFIVKGKGSECKIICTQPRRISAISVAQRVAYERNEKLGESVGYQIRLEKTMPRDRGSILFCTTGVLLKHMENDPALCKISHLILDEIHERDVTSDFLITVMRDVIKYRSDIKIILMSATLNSDAFSKYYNSAPHINIPGFTYPVEQYFLEDVLEFTRYQFKGSDRPVWQRMRDGEFRIHREYAEFILPYIRQLEYERRYHRNVLDELRKPESEELNVYLIFELVKYVCEKDNDNGAILVFLPGFMLIQKLCGLINQSSAFPSHKYIVLPLHSQLPTINQQEIFNPAPKGKRKIIVSTNIAETSITIDDVTTVIDCGYIKIQNIDPESGIQTLKPERVSQANAAQRKGRAGRVKPGVCFHLMTKCRYELLDKFLKPEVLRTRLEDVILHLKMLQLGDAESFLGKLMDAPDHRSVKSSIDLLQRLGGLDNEENLTPLGYHMAKLPVDARCSKMLILASLFSCIEPILSIAATLGFKDAFQLSMTDTKEADKKRYELSNGTNSDHICMHYAIKGYEEASNPRAFCKTFCLNESILNLLIDMRKQFAQHLFDMKFISEPSPKSPANNLNSQNIGLIKAIISAGLYPNVGIISSKNKIRAVTYESMKFHPKSILCQAPSFPSPLMVYFLRLRSSSLFVHDATIIFPLPIVFFGDQFRIHQPRDEDDGMNNENNFRGVSVNGTMRFLCTKSTSKIIRKLRDRLIEILEWKISHPGYVNWNTDSSEVKILRVIMNLITAENNEEQDLSDFEDT